MERPISLRGMRKRAGKLFSQNKLAEARRAYQLVCRDAPDDAESWIALATTHRKLEELAAAESCCAHVLRRYPENVMAIHVLASIRHRKGDIQAAISLYRKALQSPAPPTETYYFIANACRETGDVDSAGYYYEELLNREPGHIGGLNNLSALYTSKGRISEALELLQRARRNSPANPLILNNLGRAYLHLGDAESAVKIFKAVVDSGNGMPEAYDNYLMSLNYCASYTARQVSAAHLEWGGRYSRSVPRAFGFADYRGRRGKVRIGFVSPDLKDHPVSRFIEPFLRYHDREEFEIFCYADVAVPDIVSERLQYLAYEWRTTLHLDDKTLAAMIHGDSIDILVDLAGHTAHNRMGVFARKPAPVQIAYIGYPNSTGLGTIDYRITDTVTDPPGINDDLYSERLFRLPHCFLSYMPDLPDVDVCREDRYPGDNITFGSFNNLAKTTPEVVRLWSGLLHRVPGSRLLLKSRSTADAGVREHFARLFRGHGIEGGRVEFMASVPARSGHLKAYDRVDIALDTFPYNGTTTTCEALWMGVPVITLAGEGHAGRVGCSILRALSLDDMVAADEAAYLDIAAELASSPGYLHDLGASMRGRMLDSPLLDYERHTRVLEDVFRRMLEPDFCHSGRG